MSREFTDDEAVAAYWAIVNPLAAVCDIYAEVGRALLSLREELAAAIKERDEERAAYDVLMRNGINVIRLSADEAENPHKHLALVKHDLAAAESALAASRRELDDAIGIGPGSNDGPDSLKHCPCGRRMVWQYAVNVDAGEAGAPVWTCPNCVQRKLDELRRECDRLREALTELIKVVGSCESCGLDDEMLRESNQLINARAALAALRDEHPAGDSRTEVEP